MTAMTEEPELAGLVNEVREGRPAAYSELIARVHARVRAWSARFVRDSDDAEDLAQEVLIGLERGVHQYHGRSRFSTWLFAVTRNAAFNRRRGERRRESLRLLREPVAESIVESPDTHDERMVTALVLKYFDKLPPRQRQIFELVDLRGESSAEVARRLDMNPVTVRTHLFKARQTIRERMLEAHEPMLKEFLS